VCDRPDNPMRRLPDWRTTLPMAQNSPRCGAKTRTARICQQPAMRNAGRCRMHGGASTGARTAEGLARMVAAKTIHGGRSAEAVRFRQMLRALRAETKRLVELV
jgi:ribosomal protein L32